MIRVLIVDDHIVVRKGLQSLLSSKRYSIDVVGEAGDGKEALEMAIKLTPDVILMDLQMPIMSGLEAIQAIMARQISTKILVLSSFGDDQQVTAAIKAGALGYLLKNSTPDELVNAIHTVALGQFSLPQELSRSLLGLMQEASASSDQSTSSDLTTRELEVLGCLANGATNKEIALDLGISLTTVRTHVSSILHKLNLENRTQAALYARNHGL